VVVVHGGGKAITKAMEESGLKATFVKGLRVTDEAAIAIVKKTLDQVVQQGGLARRFRPPTRSARPAGDTVLVCQKLEVDEEGPRSTWARGRGDGGQGEAHQEGDRRRLRSRDLPGGEAMTAKPTT